MPRRRLSPRAARQATRHLDQRLSDLNIPSTPRGGWVRAVRNALGMTQTQFARRMQISQQGAALLESAEVDGGITLDRLNRAANALGCDVQYVLVPRKPLETMIGEQALKRAEQKLARVNRSQALEASALASEAFDVTVEDLARELATNRPTDLWNS